MFTIQMVWVIMTTHLKKPQQSPSVVLFPVYWKIDKTYNMSGSERSMFFFFIADPIFVPKFLTLESKSVTTFDPRSVKNLLIPIARLAISDPADVIPDPTLLIPDPTLLIPDPTYLVTTMACDVTESLTNNSSFYIFIQ